MSYPVLSGLKCGIWLGAQSLAVGLESSGAGNVIITFDVAMIALPPARMPIRADVASKRATRLVMPDDKNGYNKPRSAKLTISGPPTTR